MTKINDLWCNHYLDHLQALFLHAHAVTDDCWGIKMTEKSMWSVCFLSTKQTDNEK